MNQNYQQYLTDKEHVARHKESENRIELFRLAANNARDRIKAYEQTVTSYVVELPKVTDDLVQQLEKDIRQIK